MRNVNLYDNVSTNTCWKQKIPQIQGRRSIKIWGFRGGGIFKFCTFYSIFASKVKKWRFCPTCSEFFNGFFQSSSICISNQNLANSTFSTSSKFVKQIKTSKNRQLAKVLFCPNSTWAQREYMVFIQIRGAVWGEGKGIFKHSPFKNSLSLAHLAWTFTT